MPARRPGSSVSDNPRIDAAVALAELQTRGSDGSPRVNRGPQQLLQGGGASPPAHAADTAINSTPDHGHDGPQPPVRKSTRPRAPRRQYSPPAPAARASPLRRTDPPPGPTSTPPSRSSPGSMPPRTSKPETSATDSSLGFALRKWKLATPDDILPGHTPPHYSDAVCRALWKLARSNQPIQEVRAQILAHIESRKRRDHAAWRSESFMTEADVVGAQLVLDVKSARKGIAHQDPAGPTSQTSYPDTTHQDTGRPASHRQSPAAERVSPAAERVGGQVTPPASVEMNINVASVPANTPSPSPSPPVGTQFPTGQGRGRQTGAGAARVRAPNGYSPATPATNGYATAHPPTASSQPSRPPPSSPARQQTSAAARSGTDPAAATQPTLGLHNTPRPAWAPLSRIVSPFDRQGPQPWTTPQRRQTSQADPSRQGDGVTAPVADMGASASDPTRQPSTPQPAMNTAPVVRPTSSETPAAGTTPPAGLSEAPGRKRLRSAFDKNPDLNLEYVTYQMRAQEAQCRLRALEREAGQRAIAEHAESVQRNLKEWDINHQASLKTAAAVQSALETLMSMAEGENSLFRNAMAEFDPNQPQYLQPREVNGSTPGSAHETTAATFRSLVRSLLSDKAYWERDIDDKVAERRKIDKPSGIDMVQLEAAVSEEEVNLDKLRAEKIEAEERARQSKRARVGGG